ncbi:MULTISPECIES: endopeptidase La [Cetobacterium]|jgi:ATP-dependent Lon protease|uniref:Lon protease n=1 Tax=Candidatus Cetobacterium colombiensis TaxID=3073100 RepID=A0ABU4W7H0_9FUSO|nr:endopeptidase La [Candidatus Cetobacterium colombiensis]MDX8335486.1 endopeptidase La [Candidatus Cetobacterium colombiensis]
MSRLPFLPTRDMVLFPGTASPLYVGRERSLLTMNFAMKTKNKLVLSLQKNSLEENPVLPEGVHKIGVLANIVQSIPLPNKSIKVLIEVDKRVLIENVVEEDGILFADYSVISSTEESSAELTALKRKVISLFEEYATLTNQVSAELMVQLKSLRKAGKIFDSIAFNLEIEENQKIELLEILDVKVRGYRLLEILNDEIEIASIEQKVDQKVKEKINESQKSYFIREKINTLREELGKSGGDEETDELFDKVKNAPLPQDARQKLESELKKLGKMAPYSAEATVSRAYIEAVLELPWGVVTPETLDLKIAHDVLEKDHYGLKDVKDRILDYLAVKKLNPNMKGTILCLAGPPGVGKTSLAKSVADSLGRNFVRVSLGGVRDEAEIRGHRRTYIGSMPGRIIKAIKNAETTNPVILLDEIDKMSSDFKGDPASAMLEVLDPEQNKHFEDHYLDMPFDLSKVFFIATANDLRNIPGPLRDRMEIINLSSYTEFEKLHIANNYLIKQAQDENGLTDIKINITDKAVLKIIDEYTREAGVRNLKREISSLFRKVARKVIDTEAKSVSINVKNLESYLGHPKFRPEKMKKAISKVGVVNGLAWTSVGGMTLEVQGVQIPGKGSLSLTGTLGNVMKESAMVAFTYLKANLEKFQIDSTVLEKKDIHLHFPEGATPKDGPSAGTAITTTILSVLTGRKVKQTFAMTGEITITGEVLPVGGIKEKVIGAHRAGIKNIILPEDNKVDVEEIPEEVMKDIKIYFASKYDDVEKLALEK